MTSATVTLTDAELCRKAWGLIRNTSLKQNLPARHDLNDLLQACLKFDDVVKRFLQKYGDRLELLDPTAYRDLISMQSLFSSDSLLIDNNDYESGN